MLAIHASLMLLLLAAGPAPQSPSPSPAKAKAEKARPDWINTEGAFVNGEYQKVIVVGPYSSDPECDRLIPAELEKAVAEHAQIRSPELGSRLKITAETLYREQFPLVREQYRETIETSVGPMRQVYLRLIFDRKFNHWLDQKLAQIVVARRVSVLGMAGVVVLSALAIAYLWARKVCV